MRVKTKEGTIQYRTVWMEDSVVCMIDQPKLPHRFEIFRAAKLEETAAAIKNMVVRGAPAIGATAAYGMAQAALAFEKESFVDFLRHMDKAEKTLKGTRPTAYDLFHAVDSVMEKIRSAGSVEEAKKLLSSASVKYADDSAERCRLIGVNGEKLIEPGSSILTHCNAGALGCVDHGTALAPIRLAAEKGKKPFVFVDETRPRCQGSRLTAWELVQEGIGHSIIADNAAGYFMQEGEIDLVLVGADRIAVNGDVANKIGTYEKAVLAKENDIPFYVAAPVSTFDPECGSGGEVDIEERNPEEVLFMWGLSKDRSCKVRIGPRDSGARNPAFDVTPAKYVSGYVTEKGVFSRDEIRSVTRPGAFR